MPVQKITKRLVDSLQTGPKAFVWDTEVKGFGLKVTAAKRTYIFQYRTGGREAVTQRVTIGEHGSPWSPEAARKEALRLAGLVRQGGDPREDSRQRRKAAVTLAFSDYADFFVERYLKRKWKKTWREAERILNRDIKPGFRQRPLSSLTRADIDDLLCGMDERPALKRQAYAILNKLFNWAMKTRGDISTSPMAVMEAVSTVPSRERVLSAEELAAFALAADAIPYPFGPYFRVLAGSLQRREAVAGADWCQISPDGNLWSVPAALMKNKLDHLTPCNGEVRETVTALGRKRAGLIFTTTGTTGVSGFSKAKAALDRRMVEILRARAEARGEDVADVDDSIILPPWRLHDLRRTGVTALQGMGVPVEVTEDLLTHTSGTRKGVAGVYNKYKYLPEKRVALGLWGEFMRDLRLTTLAAEPHQKWLYADRLKSLNSHPA